MQVVPPGDHFSLFLHHGFCLKNLLILQGLLLLLVALLPLVAESAPTIQSLVPAIAFTPVVCPIAIARSIIEKVPLSFSVSVHENIHYFLFYSTLTQINDVTNLYLIHIFGQLHQAA